jgi:hypothetical protein
MNVRSVDSPNSLKWEEGRPTYRASLWTQRKARPDSDPDQKFIGWGLYAYDLTDVDDVTEAVEWAAMKAREASARDEIHQRITPSKSSYEIGVPALASFVFLGSTRLARTKASYGRGPRAAGPPH